MIQPFQSIGLIFQDIPKVFNTSFVNPCWYDTDMGANGALRCLPYFFLAGFPKSGTTDLFYKMGIHPQILAGCKEPHWWTRRRFQIASGEQHKKSINFSVCSTLWSVEDIGDEYHYLFSCQYFNDIRFIFLAYF